MFSHTPLQGVAFRVHGTPAPQGSKRGFVVNGRAVIADSNPATLKTWRDEVKSAALDAMNGALPFLGPVELLVTFTLVKPKSVKRNLPYVRPDLDKLVRATCDALTTAGVYKDDSQVVTIVTSKVYGILPGAAITVRELTDEHREAAVA